MIHTEMGHTWQVGHSAGAMPRKQISTKKMGQYFRGWMSRLQAQSIWQPLQKCSVMVKRNGIMNQWAAMLLKILALKLQKPLCTVRTQQEMQPWKFLQWGNWTLSSPSFQTEQISQEKKNSEDFWIFLNILLATEVQAHPYLKKVISFEKITGNLIEWSQSYVQWSSLNS